MAGRRQLVVVADDFGIGPETDRGILELGALGLVTSTVLLVNSPHAIGAVSAWNRAGRPVELGWHPALTLDRPILAPEKVPSLVDSSGRFHSLGRFLRNSILGLVRPAEVFAEFAAQHERFVELIGHPPLLVNSHQHASLFRPANIALHELLLMLPERPFVRRVREPWPLLAEIPGARIKRLVLNRRGRKQADNLERDGFPGCDWLLGTTDPRCATRPDFFESWLSRVPGQSVELMCHPGHLDRTLIGRDCEREDECLTRRPRELELLRRAEFRAAVRLAGFELVPASRIGREAAFAAAA
jgi:chitin disaccharide deacetylase